MKILIVDDDPIIRELQKEFLGHYDHDVTAACTGMEALEIFKHDPCELLISDWMMPELTGIQLTQTLRSLPLRSYCYIILLTGQEGHRNKMTAMAAGVDAFLPKPFDAEEMEMQLAVATRILSHHAHTQRLERLMQVCCCCKKIQVENNQWEELNDYIETHADKFFTTSLCPICLRSKVNQSLIPPTMLDP